MGILSKLAQLVMVDTKPLKEDSAEAHVERSQRVIAKVLGDQLDSLGIHPGTFPDDGLVFDGKTRGYVLGVAGGSSKYWPDPIRDEVSFFVVHDAFKFVFGEAGTAVMVRTVQERHADEADVSEGAARGEADAVKVLDGDDEHTPIWFEIWNEYLSRVPRPKT